MERTAGRGASVVAMRALGGSAGPRSPPPGSGLSLEVAPVSTPVHVKKDRELAQMRKQVGELNAQLDSMNFELDEARLAREEAEAEAEAARAAKAVEAAEAAKAAELAKETAGAEFVDKAVEAEAKGVVATEDARKGDEMARADAVTETAGLVGTEDVGVSTEVEARAEVIHREVQSDVVGEGAEIAVRASLEAEMSRKVELKLAAAAEIAAEEVRAEQGRAERAGKALEEAERMMAVKNEVIHKVQGELDASLERLDAVEEELGVAETDRKAQANKVSFLEARVAELETAVASMQTEVAEAEAAKAELAKGMAKLCHKHTGIKLLPRPGAEGGDDDECEDEEGEIKAARAQLEDAQTALDQVRVELEIVRASDTNRKIEIEALHATSDELRSGHDEIKAERDILQANCVALKDKLEELESEMAGFEAKYELLEAKQVELQAENVRIMSERDDFESQCDSLRAETVRFKERVGDLEAALSQKQATTTTEQSDEVAQLKADLEAKEKEIEALEAEEERVSLEAAERVDAARSKAEYAQAKLEIVRGQLSEAKESMDELEKEVSRLRCVTSSITATGAVEGSSESIVTELRAQLASARDAAEASEVRAFRAGVERDAMERKLEAMATEARDGIEERNEALRCQQMLVEKVKAECDTYAGEVRRLSMGGGGEGGAEKLRELVASNESLQESVRLQSLSSATLLQRLGAAQVELGGVSTERNMLRALLQEASALLMPLDHGKEVHLGVLRDTLRDGLSAIGRAHEANATQRRYSLPASTVPAARGAGGMGLTRMGALPHTPVPSAARPIPQTASRASPSPKA